MLQLIYTSEATSPDAEDEFHSLCAEGARNNARDEITGILVLKTGYYLQALEGPKVLVEDAFLRIMRDGRHRDLVLLARSLRTSRQFGDWSMAALTEPESDDAIERVWTMLNEAPAHVQRDFQLKFWPRSSTRSTGRQSEARL